MYRSMRTVKGSLGYSPQRDLGIRNCPATRAFEDRPGYLVRRECFKEWRGSHWH